MTQPSTADPARSSTPGATPLADESSDLDALSIANRLRPVLLRLNRTLRGEAHEMGVTSTQASLLAAINRAPGIGPGQLAQLERMRAPTLVAHIDKLEAAHLVERTRGDPHDRRRVGLSLSVSGREVLETLRARRTAWLATRLATLPAAELAAVEAAIEPLTQLARRLS
jgi:DNA-binding MarR family transcriptional regulator